MEEEQILKLINEEKIEIKGVSVGTQFRLLRRIENLINRYKEQEKIIELMAKAFKQDDIRNEAEIIEYFRKEAKKNERPKEDWRVLR